MIDEKTRIELRLLKYQDYVKRNPQKPYGYYGLGIIYGLLGKNNLADKQFAESLKLDPDYTPSRLAKFELLVLNGRYAAACRYYEKNYKLLTHKKIYILKLNRIISKLYSSSIFLHKAKRIWLFSFIEGFSKLQKMFNTGKDNIIVNLLLAMLFLKEGKKDERALVVYNLCIDLPGISDDLRWDLLNALSIEKPDIFEDLELASLFGEIPEGAFGTSYCNTLFTLFIKQDNLERIQKTFSLMQKKQAPFDRKALWQYIYYCYNKNTYPQNLSFCCQKLISSGWIDKVLADILNTLKTKGTIENSKETEKILKLYGY